MTDLTPAERITPEQLQECYRLLAENSKDESLAWMTAHILHDALQEEWTRANDAGVALDAERARTDAEKASRIRAVENERQWQKQAQEAEARVADLEAVAEAARAALDTKQP